MSDVEATTTVASLDEKRDEVAEREAPKRTVLGGQAAAALRERRAAAGNEVLLYQIGEKEFRVRYPLSAATLIYVSEMMSDDGLDYKAFAKTITSLFHHDDQDAVMTALTASDTDEPVDVEYLSDLFQEIMEAVNGRPTTSQPA